MLSVFDAHIHIWDLEKLKLEWLNSCPSINKSYSLDELKAAYAAYQPGDKPALNLEGVAYVEVDCTDPRAEDAFVRESREQDPDNLIKACLYREQIAPNLRLPLDASGVREPLHIESSPAGRCLEPSFIAGLKELIKAKKVFEACLRFEELSDLLKLAQMLPELKLVINHLGNIERKEQFTEDYKALMKSFAQLPNVYLKVSGFPLEDKDFVRELLSFIKESFEPSRLLYASNFPVIEVYGNLQEHLDICREIFEDCPDFFGKNAKKLYRVNPVQIIANTIHVRPEKLAYYKELHADPFPAVNKMIRECGITRYQIWHRDETLFSLIEYEGDDFAFDMHKMDDDPETNRWWKETDPCQYRIKDARKDEWWADMDMVYDLDGLEREQD